MGKRQKFLPRPPLLWRSPRERADAHLRRPVLGILREAGTLLSARLTVGEALEALRAGGTDDHPGYFYVVDDEGVLRGVVSPRRLVTAPLDQPLGSLLSGPLRTVPRGASALQAYEMMLQYKLLALPVVERGGGSWGWWTRPRF